MTLSQLMMSIAEFLLLFNWIAEGNFKEKYLLLKKNKAALVFLLLYLMHVVGLFYTHNFVFAIDDLRIKLPLLALPVIFATTSPISRKVLINILLIHVAATFIATMVGVFIFFTTTVNDIRDISIIISHIRFALNICFAIFILIILTFNKNQFSVAVKIGFGLLIAWFLYFLLFSESFTGIIIFIIVSFFLILVYILKKTPLMYKLIFLGFLIITGSILFVYLKNIYNDYHNNIEVFDQKKLEYNTKHGGVYVHDVKSRITDNGHYTWMYVCDDELKPAWNKRSKINFDSTDKLHQPIRYTLIRYITSKGLRKDMDAVNGLSDKEVALIENGVANVDYIKKGSFYNRIKNTIWEYENYKISGYSRGQSIMQRIELWHNSLLLIKNYLLFGVGTGDPADVFAASLWVQNSCLQNSELRSHNQYLTFTIAFGIIGLIIFFISLLYPPFKLHKFSDFLYLSFFLIAFLSMFTEDTLETQAGVTFFAYFSCLFLFAEKYHVTE